MNSKICNRCNIEKNINCFKVIKQGKYYYFLNKCDVCEREYFHQYYLKNIDIKKKLNKQNRAANIEDIKIKSKKYYHNNKNTIKEYKQNYYKRNKDSIKKRVASNILNRRKNDKEYNIRCVISTSIYKALKKTGGSKCNSSIIAHLPYSIQELKTHLELQFKKWMNWDNWGRYDILTWDDNDSNTWTWNIDHIKPQSSFKFTSLKDEEFKKCWSLDNLRPYSSKKNIAKGSR
jgi:hypothetical protein